jgi:hypothetical protein
MIVQPASNLNMIDETIDGCIWDYA